MIAGQPLGSRAKALQYALHSVLENVPAHEPFSNTPGMSGQFYRHVINRVIGRINCARYLEIGAWKGSTLLSALWGNTVDEAVVIDNWSEFGGPRDEFLSNIRTLSNFENVTVIDSDWRKVDFSGLGEFDVFLCDGPHDHDSQRDTAIAGLACLRPQGIFIVDDWNWDDVRGATSEALLGAKRQVIYSIEVRTTVDSSHSSIGNETSKWHNGYLLAVLA